MLRLPYGKNDYKKLITDGCYYVDKTMYIEKLENVQNDAIVNLRPGRFGKSLFTSMLSYYYDINEDDNFEKLFRSTYVYNYPTKLKNSYYILKFDFSGIGKTKTTEEELMNKFRDVVISGLRLFNSKYKFKCEIDETKDPKELLQRFLDDFDILEEENKIYLLIDEYDNFTNALFETDNSLFREILGNNGFVKNFYALIKTRLADVIGKVYITGICPLSLNAMTTGFNLATDISLLPNFNSMIGLTHEEVKKLIYEVEPDESKQEEIFNIMKEHYNGYCFNTKNHELIFNATLVMYFLNYYKDYLEYPDDMLDKNVGPNDSKIWSIINYQNIYENTFEPKKITEDILDNGFIEAGLITKFDLALPFKRVHLISLLYYFGYLTIEDSTKVNNTLMLKYRIPNLVMQTIYKEYFMNYYKADIDLTALRNILIDLELGKIEALNRQLSVMVKASGSRMLENFREKDLQLMVLAAIYDLVDYKVTLEEAVGTGFMDLHIMPIKNHLKYDIIIEYKYLKKKETTEELVNKYMNDARIQLKKYQRDYKNINKELKTYVVVYSNDIVVGYEEIK